MNFDPVAYAMGKAGAGRDLLSALMGEANGGGGGGVTLETSGWIYSQGTKTTVSGNTVIMAAGSTSHDLVLRVPAALRESQKFVSGDTFILKLNVLEISNRLQIYPSTQWGGTVQRETGVFALAYKGATWVHDDNKTGVEKLTWSFTADTDNIPIVPTAGTGAASSTVYATIEVIGMSFNGDVIFGEV